MVTDSIGDLIIQIKNASRVGKKQISVPFSNLTFSVAELLKTKGFIGELSKKAKGSAKFLNIEILYEGGKPVVSDVKRVSKPGRRLYEKAKNIESFRRGYGLTVLSTPKGIMADVDAKKENLGGELLFNIW